MGDMPRFHHRREFRRRDIHVISSSVESNSSAKPLVKKHKIIPSLISLENCQNIDSNKFLLYGNHDSGNEDQIKNERTGKKQKVASCHKKNGEKKCKASAIEPTTLNSVNIFMESLLDDLKVSGEKIFKSMREEIGKLIADDINLHPRREADGSIERSSTKNPENGSTDCYQSCKHEDDCRDATINPKFQFSPVDQYLQMQHKRKFSSGIGTQNCKDGSKFSSNTSTYVSSTSLTLNKPHFQKHKVNVPLCNNVQPMAFENKVRLNPERANLLLDSSSHHVYLSGMQQEGKIGKFARTSSRTTGYFDQNGSLVSDVRVGFPVPLHRSTSTSFDIFRQANSESLPQKIYHKLDLSVNGGATIRKTDQL